MADNTGIEWADATWNPVTGCTTVSPGCHHCYAETFAERFRGVPGHHFENGFDLQLRPERLGQPLKWARPRRIFVNSMSDLFHADVPDDFIARVFAVMAVARDHTFQVLTKRHGRMRSLLSSPEFTASVGEHIHGVVAAYGPKHAWYESWPLPNVWLGVSVENQQWADIRIPALLETPAAVRFLSMEPLLGPVTIPMFRCGSCYRVGAWTNGTDTEYWCQTCGEEAQAARDLTAIDWVIVGGESGRGARPMHPIWVRSLRDQCTRAGVPFLFKQWGEWQEGSAGFYGRKGVDHIIVEDGRHEPAKDHWAIDPSNGWYVSDLIRARSRRDKGTNYATYISRVGKKAAGRELDERTWDEFPEAVTVR